MKKQLAVVALVIALIIGVFAIAPSQAQKSLAHSIYMTGLKAYEKGNFREALRLFQQCAEIAKTTPHTAAEDQTVQFSLAEALRSMGQYDEAERTFKEVLKAGEKLPEKDRKTFWVFNDLAVLYQDLGRYSEAEGLWKQCELMIKKNDVARGLYPTNDLARLYYVWGKLAEEGEYCKKAGQLLVVKNAANTLALPYWEYNLGQYYELKGNYPESEKHYKVGLARCTELVGANHPYCAGIEQGLAELYRKQSRYAEAEKCLESAQKILEATYQSDHPQYCENMVRRARVQMEQGKYSQARELVTTALKSEETLFGTNDSLYTSRAKDCLGNIYRQDGRYQEAHDILTQALTSERNVLGYDNIEVATTMRDLALVEADEANYKESEELLNKSLTAIEQQTGPEHPERAAAANALAHVYLQDHKYAEALPLFKKAMELSEKALGSDNPVTAGSARDLGELYIKEKMYPDAQACLQKSLTIDEKLYGEKAPQVAADLMELATVYGAQGQANKAEPLLKRAEEIKNVLPGGNSADNDTATAAIGNANDRPVTGKWALVVGISNFKDSSINLRYAAKDATDFKNFLVSTEKFKTDHVKLLTDEAATRENIIGLLGDKWLATKVRPNDLVVVYVSSHGSSAAKDANGTNFMVAYDTNKNSLAATGIPMQWLTNIVSEQVHAAKVRLVLIMDVCHSGAVGEGQKGLTRVEGVDPHAMKIGEGQMVICSSQSDQVSWESKHYENSVFTRRLIEALQSNKEQTTMFEAYKQLKILVESEVLKDRGNLQTPLFLNKHWQGKDPILAIEPVTH